jgi:hypothetical protein
MKPESGLRLLNRARLTASNHKPDQSPDNGAIPPEPIAA